MKKKIFAGLLSLVLALGLCGGVSFALANEAEEPTYTPVDVHWKTKDGAALPLDEAGNPFYRGQVEVKNGQEVLIAYTYAEENLYAADKVKDGVLTITQQMRINEMPGELNDTWAYYATILSSKKLSASELTMPDTKQPHLIGGGINYLTKDGSNNVVFDVADQIWLGKKPEITIDSSLSVSVGFRIGADSTTMYANGKEVHLSTDHKLSDYEEGGAYLYHIYFINNTVRDKSNLEAAWQVTYEGVYNDGYPSLSQDALLRFEEPIQGWSAAEGTKLRAFQGGVTMKNGMAASAEKYDLKKGVIMQFDVTSVPVWQADGGDAKSFISIGFRDRKTWDDAAGNGFTLKYRPDNDGDAFGTVKGQYDINVASEDAIQNYGKLNSAVPVLQKRHTVAVFYREDCWVLVADGVCKTFELDSHIFGMGDLSEACVFINVASSAGEFGVTLQSVAALDETADWAAAAGTVSATDGVVTLEESDASYSAFVKSGSLSVLGDKALELRVTPLRIPEYSANGASDGNFSLTFSPTVGTTDPEDVKSFTVQFSFENADTLKGVAHMGYHTEEFRVAYERGKPIIVRFGFDENKNSVIEINGAVILRESLNRNSFTAGNGYLSVRCANDLSAAAGWKLSLETKEVQKVWAAEAEPEKPGEEQGGCGSIAATEGGIAALALLGLAVLTICKKKKLGGSL